MKYQSIYNFSDIASYGLYSRDNEFNDWQQLTDAKRNNIELAIENAMDDIQLSLTSIEEADVVVTYFLMERNYRALRQYNSGVNYCSYCLTYAGSGSKQDKLEIVPGSLVIDVIKPTSRRSIWRASYLLKLKEKDTSLDVNAKVIEAVEHMIAQFAQTKANGKPSG